jgi:hypothetical protein
MNDPIYIPTDDGRIFTLQPLSYRERIALAQKLLLSFAEHNATPRHLLSDINRAVGTMTKMALMSLRQTKTTQPSRAFGADVTFPEPRYDPIEGGYPTIDQRLFEAAEAVRKLNTK